VYSLHLECSPEDVDFVSAELWEYGTQGIRELDYGDKTRLIAGFERNARRLELMQKFAAYSPAWEQEDAIDWVQHTHDAWPPREVGQRIFLVPLWSEELTPQGRVRVVHNPGLACGTGEHPCTQLALIAMEENVTPGARVVDIGAGSGVLSVAALILGARNIVATDIDEAAIPAVRENFELNGVSGGLVVGSADCLRDGCADLTIANISGTVLLGILEDLVRITSPEGWLILTGFPEAEFAYFRNVFPESVVTAINEWRCLVTKPSLRGAL
jgi:ribosomal protein L11 methyltransferase